MSPRGSDDSSQPRVPRRRRARAELLALVLLASATLVAYAHVCTNDFFNLDDYEYVLENPHVRALTFTNIGWALTTFHSGNWHPLTWLSLQLDYQLFGGNPFGYHLTNLLLHVVNTLLLFAAWRWMTGAVWRSAWLAALFAVHPLHVESVAWVAERKDVLSTLFWVLTMLTYARYAERPSLRRYLPVVLAFGLGLTAKSMLVTLPFVLLLLDWWPLRRWQAESVRRLLGEKTPLFVLAAGAGVLVLLAQATGKLVTSLEELPLPWRIANALVAYVRYLAMTIWPSDLTVYYPHPRDTLSPAMAAGAGLLLAGLTVLLVRQGRCRPYLTVGWLWYLGTLVPVIGLVQVATQALADRYTYVPLIGLFLIMAWGIPDLAGGWRYAPAVVAVPAIAVVAVYLVATWVQVGYWRDSITLWRHTLAVTTDNYVAHSNLGVALRREGRMEEAMRHFAEALRLRPDLPGMRNSMGVALLDQGQTEEAIGHFTAALRLDPRDPRTYFYLGTALLRQGKIEDAVQQFSEALRLNGELTDAHVGLGVALWQKGELDGAEGELTAALAIDPDGPQAALTHYQLGEVLEEHGKLTEALPHYAEAVRLRPDDVRFHCALAWVLAEQSQTEAADAHYRQALELNPSWPEALREAAWSLAVQTDCRPRAAARAVKWAQQAWQATGNQDARCLDTLAAAYAAAGRFDEAARTARKALERARLTRQDELVSAIRDRLERYEKGKTVRDSARH
jgi:tetratricopeptide (TPR) repeat protein